MRIPPSPRTALWHAPLLWYVCKRLASTATRQHGNTGDTLLCSSQLCRAPAFAATARATRFLVASLER
eukprot:scaffold6724_cov104-Isochrysis_galbana.AAC.2